MDGLTYSHSDYSADPRIVQYFLVCVYECPFLVSPSIFVKRCAAGSVLVLVLYIRT